MAQYINLIILSFRSILMKVFLNIKYFYLEYFYILCLYLEIYKYLYKTLHINLYGI